jgi:hypothetical protein
LEAEKLLGKEKPVVALERSTYKSNDAPRVLTLEKFFKNAGIEKIEIRQTTRCQASAHRR